MNMRKWRVIFRSGFYIAVSPECKVRISGEYRIIRHHPACPALCGVRRETVREVMDRLQLEAEWGRAVLP